MTIANKIAIETTAGQAMSSINGHNIFQCPTTAASISLFRDLGFGNSSLEFNVQGLGLGVWGLGLCNGLGCGV